MECELRPVRHRGNQSRRGTNGARPARCQRVQKFIERWLLAPAQHREEAQAVGLDVRNRDGAAVSLRVGSDKRGDLRRRAGGTGRIAAEREQRLGGGRDGKVAIGGVRRQGVAHAVRLGVAAEDQFHHLVHGAAPDQIAGRAPGCCFLQIAPMEIGADAEHEVDVDLGMPFGEAAQQRLAIAPFGRRQQRQPATGPDCPGRFARRNAHESAVVHAVSSVVVP